MATGNYASPAIEARRGRLDDVLDFFGAEAYADKMQSALSFPRKAAPGTNWNYHTSDTFLATRAMDDVLKDHEGSDAEIFAMLRDEVLKPAKVGPDSLTTAAHRQLARPVHPSGGYGMFWTQDDIAKVAKLSRRPRRRRRAAGPPPWPSRRERCRSDPADRGVTTSGAMPFHYNNGFWAQDFMQRRQPAYTSPFSVPFMSGFGGITVALMPNGSSYYVFSDNNEFAWRDVVSESNKLAPMTGGGN